MSPLQVVEAAILLILGLAATLAVVRVVRDVSIPDKVVAADLMVTILGAAVAAAAGLTGESNFIYVAVVVTMLGFVATITVARFVEKRGPRV